MAGKFSLKMPDFHVALNAVNPTIWDPQLYFPSEGRCAEDFFALKNLTASAGFEPTNLCCKGQHATSRPLKPHVPGYYKKMAVTCKDK
jgi:hypothetical protein